ncbi:putative methyltransferase-domain-containing protein, partial [Pilaira anomala]
MTICYRRMSAKIENDDEEYYSSLQKYSTLYRILLSRPYFTETTFNKWNRIDLKLVNELGLTLTHFQKMNCFLEVNCQLLVERNGQFKTCTEYRIQCRPLQHDAWEFTANSGIAGFHHDAEGDFEYMISTVDEEILLESNERCYIQISPLCKSNLLIQAFPLVIGPITIKEQSIVNTWNQDDSTVVSQDIYHAYYVEEDVFMLIKENWELGTPGKVWDSALVISQLFSDKIKSDPSQFKHHRILDLSAGTGCVGLLMALLYRKNITNLPQITMTDLPEALDLIYQNRAANHLESYTKVQALRWGNYNDVQCLLRDGSINTIIASDVIYEPASFPKLVQTLDWLSESVETKIDIFLGYKRRGLSREDEQSFFDICAEKFVITILPSQSNHEGWILGSGFSDIFEETGVNIYQLVRK